MSKFEAVAVKTISKDGRLIGKAIIHAEDNAQALAIAEALSPILPAIPCRGVYDVFGKLFWTNERD